jgi:hypothetical protein
MKSVLKSIVLVSACITFALASFAFQAEGQAQGKKLSESKEFLWIRANQRILLKKLKDPDSAKFSDEFVSYKIGGPVVCGKVNSKNSFGGFTGPKYYIGGGDTVGVFTEEEVEGFAELWNKVCAR